jgi:hypothetical protein
VVKDERRTEGNGNMRIKNIKINKQKRERLDREMGGQDGMAKTNEGKK